jgi:hypothetical protein
MIFLLGVTVTISSLAQLGNSSLLKKRIKNGQFCLSVKNFFKVVKK